MEKQLPGRQSTFIFDLTIYYIASRDEQYSRTCDGCRVLVAWPLKIDPIVCATSLQVVLITASGLQGEQPLVFGCMQVREVGKLDP